MNDIDQIEYTAERLLDLAEAAEWLAYQIKGEKIDIPIIPNVHLDDICDTINHFSNLPIVLQQFLTHDNEEVFIGRLNIHFN